MQIRRLEKEGWKPVHHNTALLHRLFSSKEISSPFQFFWATVQKGTSMETDPGHRESELLIVSRGKGTVIVSGEKERVSEGDAVYVPAFAVHTIEAAEAEDLRLVVFKYWEPDAK